MRGRAGNGAGLPAAGAGLLRDVLFYRYFCSCMKRLLLFPLIVLAACGRAGAQELFDMEGNRIDGYEGGRSHFAEADDSVRTVEMPARLYVWRVDERWGDTIAAEPDTMPGGFQNANLTDGVTGRYNTLGNLGSPRMARLFMSRPTRSDFIFADPFDFFIRQPGEFRFTNTLSPITNITYDECGDRTDGEDRIKALFAINAGRDVGLGFKIDYLYGRGYYANQSTSEFNGTVYGSYKSDRYKAHLYFSANHLKAGENGGVESDVYITDPQSLPDKYSSTDIPTVLSKAWNRVYTNTLFFSHRYSLGFYRTRDGEGNVVENPNDTVSLDSLTLSRFDSTQVDSLKRLAEERLRYTSEFIPVTSVSHSLRIDGDTRKFVNNTVRQGYYLNQYFDGDSVNDKTDFLNVSNTLALHLHEGFNKWAQAGVSVFGQHEFMRFKLPETRLTSKSYTENRITVGGRLQRTRGKLLRYSAEAAAAATGGDFGQFALDGKADLTLPIKKDTIRLSLHARASRELPSFYYRHYHSQHAWWDNDGMGNEFRTRFEGELSYNRTRTRLRVSVENVKNYTYFAAVQQPYAEAEAEAGENFRSNGVSAEQHSGSIQVLEAMLNQDLRLGILNWENELACSTSSDKDVLPLPKFSAYSNLYLHFKIAKVLSVRFGGDVKFFTKYYAPTYSPIIGQFALQDKNARTEIGAYPIISVYANMHLKHTRFYIMATHVNKSGSGGKYFLVPHYPVNPMTIKFGLSWNFFN